MCPKFKPYFSDYSNLDNFCNVVCKDIEALSINELRSGSSNNLSPSERVAWVDLQKMDNIVIKMSDKGGNIVLMQTDHYRNMVLSILGDIKTYKILGKDPTEHYSSLLINILDEARLHNVINQEEYLCNGCLNCFVNCN